MARICLISDLHLVSNPRLWKEANSLAKAGHEVTILTVWTSASRRDKDFLLLQYPGIRYEAAVNLIAGEGSPLLRFYRRLRHRIAVECKRFFKLDTAWLLGYAPATMIKSALQKNADLYICHAEWGALIGKALIEKDCRVAYDIEDWYSRDYLVPTRPVRLLEKLETFALAKGRYCSCPSNSMADALALTYRSKKPSVIYNGFSDVDTPDLELMSSYKSPSFVWFSQTIGPGRGLEILTEILRHYDRPVEVHLIGDCVEGYEEQLKNVFPFTKGHQLIFHPSVPHHQLLKEVTKYQIGLALELSYPDNKNTTVSNKMLQYVQAGIKILASDTKGQSEIAAFIPSSVELISLSDKDKWLQALDSLIDRDYDRALQRNIFLTHFSWEAQEKKLLSLVSAALLN